MNVPSTLDRGTAALPGAGHGQRPAARPAARQLPSRVLQSHRLPSQLPLFPCPADSGFGGLPVVRTVLTS
jgi:hypothetical protein